MAIPVTTSNSQGLPMTYSSEVPAMIVQSTDTRGSTFQATTPVPTSGPIIGAGSRTAGPSAVTETDQYGGQIILTGATDGAVYTVTDSNGRTVRTTYHPTASDVRSVVLETSTLANGQQETFTSVVALAPTTTEGAAAQQGQTGSMTATGSVGLVTGNVGVTSRKVGKEVVALVAGAAGVAWFL